MINDTESNDKNIPTSSSFILAKTNRKDFNSIEPNAKLLRNVRSGMETKAKLFDQSTLQNVQPKYTGSF